MNKIVIFICSVVSAYLIYGGISTRSGAESLAARNRDLLSQNKQLSWQISGKQLLIQKMPVHISEAFAQVVNHMRFLEGYSGTSMRLSIAKTKDNDDIANYFVPSQYHGIRKLPVTIAVDKFSNETDMVSVLNDIYQLEVETDFKVTEIIKDENTLNVKGDVYGL